MTKRERAQVVELLRCAADNAQHRPWSGVYSTAVELGLLNPWRRFAAGVVAWRRAGAARRAVHGEGAWLGYEHECLEAAARIEEGGYP